MTDHKDLALRLREQIECGEFRAGQRLPGERQIASNLGVARGTLRRALDQLVEWGLIERRGGSGTYVCHSLQTDSDKLLDEVRPLELIDARLALEPDVCRRVVLHARDSDLNQMEDLLNRMDQLTRQPEEFGVVDREFHLCLAELSGNQMLVWFTRQLAEARLHDRWGQVLRSTQTEEVIRAYNTEHRAIMVAIRQRRADHAAQLMRSHLNSARSSLMDLAEA